MKVLFYAFTLSLFASVAFSQTVRIVDNNFNAPTGPNVYTTLQAAENDCVDGDIIYVQPSTTKYGSVTIDVPNITLIGIGFNLTKDLAYGSTITNVSLYNNPENTASASGAIITGLTIDNIYPGLKRTGTGDYVQSDILIYNNNIRYIYQSPSYQHVQTSNFVIRDNRITDYLIIYVPTSNLLIRNNLFPSGYINLNSGPNTATITNNILYGDIRTNNAADNIIIEHNNFIGSNSSSVNAFSTLRSDLVSNNIFYGRSPRGSSTFYDNIFTANVSFGTFDNTLPPAGVGGQNTGSPNYEGEDPQFVNVPILNTYSANYDFTPQGAAILGAGSDGTDIGITGGAYPWGETNFKLDTSPLPTIESFNTTTTINPGDDLPVQIRAKGN